MFFTLLRWQDSHVARQHAQRRADIVETADRLLQADCFDPAAIRWLADRERFADATRCLRLALDRNGNTQPDPLGIFAECRRDRRFLPSRLAREFGAINEREYAATFFGINDLKALANGQGSRAARARLALAGCGECDWTSATRQERAAYALAALVREAWP